MLVSDFDYNLPLELIANEPVSPRDHSKLMILHGNSLEHRHFYDLPSYLNKGDVLVLNESKVIPARIRFNGREILLLKELDDGVWEAMVRPGCVFKKGVRVEINAQLSCKVLEEGFTRILEFDGDLNLDKLGEAPFPPYIKNSKATFDQYQTVYAKNAGSVAAPTAGLHFTEELINKLRLNGVGVEFLTLHVGLSTFQPVKVDSVEDHEMHSEWYSLSEGVAERLNESRGRIVAVGTTSVRVLESCFRDGRLRASTGETSIFIYPGYDFKVIDGIITNFHLPKSTLLMLVSALVGREYIMEAYKEAIKEKYRFYSFGDAMFIL